MAAAAEVRLELASDDNAGRGLRPGVEQDDAEQLAVRFESVPADVAVGDDIVVWYGVTPGGRRHRARSGDWVGLFACVGDDDRACVAATYSYVAFQWAPRYPNGDRTSPRRRLVFTADQIKVCIA